MTIDRNYNVPSLNPRLGTGRIGGDTQHHEFTTMIFAVLVVKLSNDYANAAEVIAAVLPKPLSE